MAKSELSWTDILLGLGAVGIAGYATYKLTKDTSFGTTIGNAVSKCTDVADDVAKKVKELIGSGVKTVKVLSDKYEGKRYDGSVSPKEWVEGGGIITPRDLRIACENYKDVYGSTEYIRDMAAYTSLSNPSGLGDGYYERNAFDDFSRALDDNANLKRKNKASQDNFGDTSWL